MCTSHLVMTSDDSSIKLDGDEAVGAMKITVTVIPSVNTKFCCCMNYLSVH